MKVVVASLQSISPYSQSKRYTTEKLNKESHADYEARTWRDRLHTDDKGVVYIPPMGFKNCISEAAKFLSERIPGKGQATYTKHFERGVLVLDGPSLGVKKDGIEGEWLFVPSDGKRGGGKRVDKCFPIIREWKADVTFHILDETITREVFEHHLTEAGNFVGIGRFRPASNGFYGRFKVAKFSWK